MHDARDAFDRQLLDAGDYTQLLAGYFDVVMDRCFLRVRNEDMANEAAQQVFVRLLGELRSGKRYAAPCRVVVWMVTGWTVRSLYPGAKTNATLPPEWDPAAPDAFAEWEDDHDLERLLADLPDRQREVAQLTYRDQLGAQQI